MSTEIPIRQALNYHEAQALLAEVERLTAERDAAKDTWTPIEDRGVTT